MTAERRDIVVIGAGPGGSAAARQAALAGLRPLLVERDPAPGATNACGGFAAEVYRRRLELPDEVVEREIRTTRLVIDGRRYDYGGRRPHYISFRREPFDSWLARRAVEAGAELLTSAQATILDPAARRVGLTDRETGAEREVEADVIVFADGPRTLAADAFGIGHRPGPRTRHAIFAELDSLPADGATCELVVSTAYAKSYFWLFPKRDSLWVGVGGTLDEGGPPLRPRLDAFIEGRDDLRGRPIRHQGGGLVPMYAPCQLAGDGVVAVGDAGGLVNPMTGGGIAFALASGEIAGRVAAEAVKAGRTDRAALAKYPQLFRRTPHYWWLKLMALWGRRLERRHPAAQPAAYARMLRRYIAFFHRVHWLVDFALDFPRR